MCTFCLYVSFIRKNPQVGCPTFGVHFNYDFEKYLSLWQTDDYLKYFDRIFERLSDNNNDLYGWRYADAFRDILGHGENDQVVLERQEKWVLHAVDQYAADDKIFFLFSAISETGTKLRECAFREFISRNSNYAMFEKIQLDSNSWFGSTSEIVTDLQSRIEFLESLLPYVHGIKYLQHAKRIRDRIEFWKDQIEREETEAITRKLKQSRGNCINKMK